MMQVLAQHTGWIKTDALFLVDYIFKNVEWSDIPSDKGTGIFWWTDEHREMIEYTYTGTCEHAQKRKRQKKSSIPELQNNLSQKEKHRVLQSISKEDPKSTQISRDRPYGQQKC